MLGAKGVRLNCVSPGGFFTGQPEPFLTKNTAHLLSFEQSNQYVVTRKSDPCDWLNDWHRGSNRASLRERGRQGHDSWSGGRPGPKGCQIVTSGGSTVDDR